jgi:hypothetical protein
MSGEAGVPKEVLGLSYSFGPFPVPPDSHAGDPDKDANRRSLRAEIVRDSKVIATASAVVPRHGHTKTAYNIEFDPKHRDMLSAEIDTAEESLGEKPDRRADDAATTDAAASEEPDRPATPSAPVGRPDKPEDTAQAARTTPRAAPPSSAAPPQDPYRNALAKLGFEVLRTETWRPHAYTVRISDPSLAAAAGLKRKKAGSFIAWVEEEDGQYVVYIPFASIVVTDWGLVPAHVRVAAKDVDGQYRDIRPPSPNP